MFKAANFYLHQLAFGPWLLHHLPPCWVQELRLVLCITALSITFNFVKMLYCENVTQDTIALPLYDHLTHRHVLLNAMLFEP